ncbi:hypothetical protein SE17_35505 [Kouleothrix aurantiaca]|uniref:Uncharacterized protein n=1 Tax=Kouleothrix aurantiaca TaxID=186479 RepID=A0A0P9DFZ0_9CHLR|nr:hypothetical protein SE17_35505 [Kouleothrix aurantiaca]
MAAVSGLGTIFNLPQYAGSIMLGASTDTPFLDAIGGLAYNDPDLLCNSVLFQWGVEDLPAAAQPAILEGADATFSEQSGTGPFNVVQIFQEAVDVSYSRQGSYMTLSPATSSFTSGDAAAIRDILAHQISLKIPKIRRDVNYSFVNGSYQLPANNATARKTRGLLSAISTNTTAAAGGALTEDMVLDMIQQVFDARGVMQEWEPTILVGSTKKRELTTIFVRNSQFQQQSRRVGGANCQAIESDFGLINVMTERTVPATVVGFAHLRLCRPRFMPVPGKGVFFAEPLAKTGSSDRYQIYGEAGLEYGDEARHAKITGLA